MTNRTSDLPAHLRHLAGKPERKPRRGVMNKLERAYADHLTMLVGCGEIRWFGFEPMTLRLATGARYTPDFVVMLSSGELQFGECKGFSREASRVRIKVAASLYPFRFIVVRMHSTRFEYEIIRGLYDTLKESRPA